MKQAVLSPRVQELRVRAQRVRDLYQVFKKQRGGIIGQKLDKEMTELETLLTTMDLEEAAS